MKSHPTVNTLMSSIEIFSLIVILTIMLMKHCMCTYKPSTSLAGFFAPAGPLTIWKRQAGEKNCNESYAYRSFLEDPLRDFVPKFYREVTYNKEGS